MLSPAASLLLSFGLTLLILFGGWALQDASLDRWRGQRPSMPSIEFSRSLRHAFDTALVYLGIGFMLALPFLPIWDEAAVFVGNLLLSLGISR